MQWYALFVESGKEEVVQRFLRMYFNESSLISLIPRRRVPEKKNGAVHHILKILFPGYLLVKTNMTADVYYTLKKIPGFYKIATQGSYYSKEQGFRISTVSDQEVSLIQQLIGDTEIIEYSQIYLEGSRVIVQSGPLTGMEGIIKKIDKHKKRAKISLNFMKTERTVDVGVEILASSRDEHINNEQELSI